MWRYEKRLQFPVNIKEPNAEIARYIISQYGGPDGEMGASMRYLSQRYAMPYGEQKAVLTDIGVSVAKLRIWNPVCMIICEAFLQFPYLASIPRIRRFLIFQQPVNFLFQRFVWLLFFLLYYVIRQNQRVVPDNTHRFLAACLFLLTCNRQQVHAIILKEVSD